MKNPTPTKTIRTVRIPRSFYEGFIQVAQKHQVLSKIKDLNEDTMPSQGQISRLLPLHQFAAQLLEAGMKIETEIEAQNDDPDEHKQSQNDGQQLGVAKLSIARIDDPDVVALQLETEDETWGELLLRKSRVKIFDSTKEKFVGVRIPEMVVHYINLALTMKRN